MIALDWDRIRLEERRAPSRELMHVIRLLASLASIRDGFPVDQFTHSLQMASRAHRAGERAEVVCAALCHDMGKPLTLVNHPAVAAEILRPHVGHEVYEVLRHHGEFVADRNHGTEECQRYEAESWYGLACAFGVWDCESFDPDYPSLPVSVLVGSLIETLAS